MKYQGLKNNNNNNNKESAAWFSTLRQITNPHSRHSISTLDYQLSLLPLSLSLSALSTVAGLQPGQSNVVVWRGNKRDDCAVCSDVFGLYEMHPLSPLNKIFALPRLMECRRGLAMRILSVCPSLYQTVCPSGKRVNCDKTEKNQSTFLYHTKDHLA